MSFREFELQTTAETIWNRHTPEQVEYIIGRLNHHRAIWDKQEAERKEKERMLPRWLCQGEIVNGFQWRYTPEYQQVEKRPPGSYASAEVMWEFACDMSVPEAMPHFLRLPYRVQKETLELVNHFKV